MKNLSNRTFAIIGGGATGLCVYLLFNHLFLTAPNENLTSSPQEFIANLSSLSIQNIIPSALSFYDQGFAYLTPLLEEKIKSCYLENKEEIQKFPFSEYSVIDVPGQGKFFVDQINDTIKNCLRAHIPWEGFIKGVIERFVKPGTIALDIGAHIGTHTLTMSKCVGSGGKVFAFEPNKKIFRELCMNLALNKANNVQPIRCALGKEKNIITLVSSHPANEGGTYVIKEQLGLNTAALIQLDEFDLTNISFIKMDVENMEAEVLDGAIATIRKNRPVMLIEIQGNNERSVQLGENMMERARETMEKIISLGYRLERIGQTFDFLAFPT